MGWGEHSHESALNMTENALNRNIPLSFADGPKFRPILYDSRLHGDGLSFEVEVNLRSTVIRSVCLGVRHPSGTRDKFFFLLEISFRQLRVYYFVAPSLTRGRICNLLYNSFWALLEQPLLGRSPAELTAIFYCLIWDSPHLEGQVPLFIFPRNRVAQLYPRALGSLFVAPYDSQWRYSNPPPHGLGYPWESGYFSAGQ
jgi:hypothetical protein